MNTAANTAMAGMRRRGAAALSVYDKFVTAPPNLIDYAVTQQVAHHAARLIGARQGPLGMTTFLGVSVMKQLPVTEAWIMFAR